MLLGPLMLDVSGAELTSQEAEVLARPGVGGVILFSRNFNSICQVKDLIDSMRAIRPELILAVDQEGGRVQRFKKGLTRLPPLSVLGKQYTIDPDAALANAVEFGWLMAAEMISLGLDISFAPVLDLDFGKSAVIGDRAFHRDPEILTALASRYIAGMREAGMAATGKHFPGHGWVEADSHVAIPEDKRGIDALTSQDLIPFKALANDLGGIMPAHVIYSTIDKEPAGFSAYWLQTVLRQQLGFQGVIFSDDLTMEGASVAGDFASRARAAQQAGCDMVLVCNQFDEALNVLEVVEGDNWVPDQQRLQQMRANKAWDLTALQNDKRWLSAQQLMQIG